MNRKDLNKWKLRGIKSFFIVMLYLFLMVITVYSSLAYDSETTTLLNESSLPSSGTLIFTLNGQPNGTAFIHQQQFNSHVTLSFPSQLFFGDNTIVNLPVDYTVEDFFVPDDFILLNTSLNITNDFNLSSSELGILFQVNKESVINVTSVDTFEISTEGYSKTISKNILPKSENLDFLFKGAAGSKTTLTNCGIWLTCPSEIIMDVPKKTVPIPYTIPYNTSVGFYDMSFNAVNNDSNVTRIGIVQFTIIEQNITFQQLVLKNYDECYTGSKTEQELVNCFKRIDEENDKLREESQQKALRDIFAQCRGLNNTQIQEVEKLVMVGSVDKDLKANLDTCTTNLAKAQEDTNSCNARNSGLIEEKSRYDDFLNKKDEEKKALNETAQQELEKSKQYFKWILYAIGGILLCSAIFGWYKITAEKYNHRKL